MSDILIDRNPSAKKMKETGVLSWPIWTKEVSEFPWHYDQAETCHFLEGVVSVTTSDGTTVQIGKGDLVTFPAGLSCTWKIKKAVKKHYNFR